MLNINTSEILQKEMDRKDFLKHVGIGIVAMTGVAAGLRAMGYLPTRQTTPSLGVGKPQPAGYGASVYGGRANNA